MKNVLVLMGYRTMNYGSILQACATMEMLIKCNCNPVALNLDNLWNIIYRRKIKYYLLSGDIGFILKSKGRQITRFLNHSYSVKLKSREQKFIEFINLNIKRSEPVNDFEEARKLSAFYDCVLLGSDQVWLPSSVITDVYTLSFVHGGVKKVAYAPSFGLSNIPRKCWTRYRKMFDNIDYIALREQRGKQIVEEISDKICPVVADPVLMLDKSEWEKIVKPCKIDEEKYIFCYLMGRNRWQREWIKKFAQSKGYVTVGLLHLDEKIGFDDEYYDKQLIDISPDYFLNLLRGAEMVFTDSFHCTCFSIIEHKDFWCFKRFDDANKVSTNSRMNSLLSLLKIKERMIEKKESNIGICDCPIDYYCVDKILENFRYTSYQFLKESIIEG